MRQEEPNVRYQRMFAILYETTRMLNSGMELRMLLKHLAGEISELMCAESCTIMLLDEEQNELLCKASSGLGPGEESRFNFRMGDGVVGWVAAHGEPALIPDVKKDSRFNRLKAPEIEIASLLCVPIKNDRETIGAVTMTSSKQEAFSKEDEETLLSICRSVVQDFQNARYYQLSITDPLTHLYNRQYLFHKLPEETERCKRYGNNLSIVILDIDFFGKLNRTSGRIAGDQILKELSLLVERETRDVDSVIRFGGEEFLILLPQTALKDAVSTSERIRKLIENTEIKFNKSSYRITVSSGVAQYSGSTDSEGFIRQAVEALLKAKSLGRNRTEAYCQTVKKQDSIL